ncbi:GlcG/HbpS family heme-binding protein [Kaarinaea lacus]
MRSFIFISITLISITAVAEDEVFVTTRVLTASTASQLAVAAEGYCARKGYQVSVAVVDRYGNLLSFIRNPLSGVHTIGVAQDKAYTAATFQGATLELGKQLEFLKGTPRVSLVGGGVPVRVGGYIYGAVGISGAPRDKIAGDVDDECARAGIDAVKEALEFAG